MGKRARRERRRLLAATSTPSNTPSNNDVPGGLPGAEFRAANGRATMKDADFLQRVRREMEGREGYSGDDRKGSSSFFSSPISSDKKGSKGSRGSSYTFRTVTPSIKKEDGVFCVESNEVTKDCPLNPKVPSVLISPMVWDTFMRLAATFETEWIALMIGKFGEDESKKPAYIIEKFYFPPQTASGTHVDVPTGIKPRPGTIGAIHSHVNMGVFFSGTDNAHSNWPVEIVINRRKEYKALTRHQLKCGEWAKNDATVYLVDSALTKASISELTNAFVKGEEIEKAAKSRAGSTGSTGSHATYPPGVAAEDRLCGNAWKSPLGNGVEYLCMEEFGHSGMCKTSNGVHWYPKFSDPVTSISDSEPKGLEPCPETRRLAGGGIERCVREKGHVGMCKESGGTYFTHDDSPSSSDPASASTGGNKQLTWPFSEVVGLDDSEGEDWDCQKCAGTGFVSNVDSATKVTITTECPDCKGDGLTAEGRIEMAKELAN